MTDLNTLLLWNGSLIFCILFMLTIVLTNWTIRRIIVTKPDLNTISEAWGKVKFPFDAAYKFNIPPYSVKEDIPTFLHKYSTGERKINPVSYLARFWIAFFVAIEVTGLISYDLIIKLNSAFLLIFTMTGIYLCYRTSRTFDGRVQL